MLSAVAVAVRNSQQGTQQLAGDLGGTHVTAEQPPGLLKRGTPLPQQLLLLVTFH